MVLQQGEICQLGQHDTLANEAGMYQDFLAIKSESEGWKL